MKKILEFAVQFFFGKKNFVLPKEVPNSYLFKLSITHFLGIVRGFFKKIGMDGKKRYLYVGKKTAINGRSKIKIGDSVRIGNYCEINSISENGIKLGDRVKIGSFSQLLCSGSLTDLGKGIVIGSDSSFSEYTFFGAAGGITIGNNVISGQYVRFHSENHNFNNKKELIRLQGVNRKGITIGDNVWIGSGVVFLDGSRVGEGCVIAANSVVNGEFPSYSVIAGTPGVIKKMR
jgi:acetyltransferase-like isoleucine patch superfamily enzyme